MLTKTKRKEYFEYLKLGEYNEKNVLKIQKKHFPEKTGTKKNWDGEYGGDTDILLENLYNIKRYAPHFTINEFKCHCGGKYCTTQPVKLSVQLLKNLEAVRTKFGGPVNISSGMRCKKWNSLQSGSASQSRHISGKAADIYGAFTSTNDKRKLVKAYWYNLKGSNYCYYGTANMGSSVHVDVK